MKVDICCQIQHFLEKRMHSMVVGTEKGREEESITDVRKRSHADVLYAVHKQHKRYRQGHVIFLCLMHMLN